MRTVEILKELCLSPGVGGCEGRTAEKIKELISPFADRVYSDKLGNLIAEINSDAEKGIILSAHMDKIGLRIIGIDKKSAFLLAAKSGKLDSRTLSAARVKVYGEKTLDGVIISTPPHLSDGGKESVKDDSIAIDCGLTYDEISALVSPGDTAEVRLPFTELLNNRLSSPFLDNAAGCTAVIKAVQKLSGKIFPYKVYAVFSTREETGKQGISTAAFSLEADTALITDVGFGSFPGVKAEQSAEIGSGIMLCRSPILSEDMYRALKKICTDKKIPFTTEVTGGRTSTDADAITMLKAGVKTALLSIPLKNMHTAVECADIGDIENTALLMAEYILGGGLKNA